jgi:hypothetical protein
MERLSIEIISMIAAEAAASASQSKLDKVFDVWDLHDKLKVPVTTLRNNSLAPFAAVSRDWQLAFEPFTFHTIILSPKRLAQAERQGYLTRRRLGYVRNVAVPITFPLPWPWDVPIIFSQVGEWPPPQEVDEKTDQTFTEDDAGSEEENAVSEENAGDEEDEEDEEYDSYLEDEDDLPPPQERGYDKIFTSIIRSLFRILKLAPVHENKQPYIDIRLGFPVPREYGWCFATHIEEPEAERTEVGWCKPLYLDLGLNEDELPELPVIASCSFELVSWSLFFTPETACKIASKMPYLRIINMHLSDKEWRDVDLRIKLRDGKCSLMI